MWLGGLTTVRVLNTEPPAEQRPEGSAPQHPKLPAQTPNEFAESVPEPTRPLVRDFTRLYLESRFGRLTAAIPQMTSLLTQIQSQSKGG